MLFENEKLLVEFGTAGGGFPTKIGLKYPAEVVQIVGNDKPFLQIGLGDGRVVFPVLRETDEPYCYQNSGSKRIQFDRLTFQDQHGNAVKDFYLTLRYEIYADGTVFVQTYFIVESFLDPVSINGFRLTVPLNFQAYEQIHTPFGMDANLTGSGSNGEGAEKIPVIKPVCNWNCKSRDGKGGYFEVFMEDAPALDQGTEHRETEIFRTESGRTVSWNFQTVESSMYHRNVWESLLQWGWVFSAPPVKRRNPPFRMYHWIDAFEDRIPTLRQAELMKNAGADVIILHEAWRSDVSGIAFPYHRERLKEFINYAHQCNMRVVLYIRGVDELSTVEDACNWFGEFLRKDWDGLYADFGGILNSRGPCSFKKHYLTYRRIRKEIGRYGLFYTHSGALSSAVGFTPEIIDGYTSGEGEMGSLCQSRFIHESLSGAYVTTGSFWSAAFPHYGSAHMIPFLAASGQYPHTPLGIQHQSSSLAHPKIPGVNDVYLRPLWKLYALLRDSRELNIFNDYNGNPAVKGLPEECGHLLMYDAERKIVLLMLSNFSGKKQEFSIEIDWEIVGFQPSGNGYYLAPDEKSPGKAMSQKKYGTFSGTIRTSSCCAVFFGPEESVKGFEQSYPAPSPEAMEYFRDVARQKALRTPHHDPRKKLYCKVRMPIAQTPCICMTAFYQTEHEIGVLDEAGNFHRAGYVTNEGIISGKPTEQQWLWAGDSSPYFELNGLFPQNGKLRIAVKSYCLGVGGCYFHSFAEILLAEEPSDNCAETIVFVNELEPDRAAITFDIELSGSGSGTGKMEEEQ